MQTVLFRRGGTNLVADVISTVYEDKQIIFFVQDKIGKRYRVPYSDVQAKYETEVTYPKKKKRRH